MLNLQNKLREQRQSGGSSSSSLSTTFSSSPKDGTFGRISVRDKLLVQEAHELSCSLPNTCHIDYPSSSHLHNFTLTVRPDDGMYNGGVFKFQIDVPQEYNMEPPVVRCLTRLWHPNITEEGSVCLSILRPTSVDGLGWAPTRHLKDVIYGLNSLFFDLMDFDDPLNIEAAEHYRKSPEEYKNKVKEYIRRFCTK